MSKVKKTLDTKFVLKKVNQGVCKPHSEGARLTTEGYLPSLVALLTIVLLV